MSLNRIALSSLFILTFYMVVFITGCSDTGLQEKQAYVNNPSEAVDVMETKQETAFDDVKQLVLSSITEELAHDPWGLVYSDKTVKSYFFIRPKSEENFYLGTDKLYNAFINSLNWVSELEPEKKENLESFDYDLVLKTNYSSEIYINTQTSIFRFAIDKKLYRLWGDKTNLWNGIQFDGEKAAADFNNDALLLDTPTIKVDLNDDKSMENICLRMKTDISKAAYSPSLYLVIDKNEKLVFDDAFEGMRIRPEVHILDSAVDKTKAIIVNSAVKPADWLPLEEYFIFRTCDKNIIPVSVVKPKVKFTVKGNKVTAEYPAFRMKKTFMVKEENLKYYGDAKSIFTSENNYLYLRGISFVKNNDRFNRLITVENEEMHKGGYFYTVETEYEFRHDKLIPVSLRFSDRAY